MLTNENQTQITLSLSEIESGFTRSLRQKDRNGRKRTPKDGLFAMKELGVEQWPFRALWMHDWVVNLMENRPVKVSTVRRYLTEVLDDVLYDASEVDFKSLDSLDFDGFYSDLLEKASHRKDLSYKARQLDNFHRFGVKQFGLPALTEPLATQACTQCVRAAVIPESIFRNAREILMTGEDLDQKAKETLWVLFTVMFRTGIRRNDALKLQLRDIDHGDIVWLRIRDNIYGDTKARRHLVPLSPWLLDDERARVEAYLLDRIRCGDSGSSLVFHPPGTPTIPWDAGTISSTAKENLKSACGDAFFTIHHFRHTALSRLQLIIEGHSVWIDLLTPYSTEQAQSIRRCLLHATVTGKNDYWCAAASVSHGNPNTTLLNYMHFPDLMLYEKLCAANTPLTNNQIRNLAGASTRTVTRWVGRRLGAKETSPARKLGYALSSDLRKFGLSVGPVSSPTPTSHPPEGEFAPFEAKTDDIDLAFRALTKFYEGMSPQLVAETFSIPLDTLERWISICDFIGSLCTRKSRNTSDRQLRHIPKSRALGQLPINLPSPANSLSDVKDISKVLPIFNQLAQESPEKLLTICGIWLNRSTTTNTGIPLHSPAELKLFQNTIGTVIPAKQWLLRIRVPDDKEDDLVIKDWAGSKNIAIEPYGKPVRSIQRFPYGIATLYLLCEDQDSKIYNSKIRMNTGKNKSLPIAKFSSVLLRYVLFMACVVYLTPSSVRNLYTGPIANDRCEPTLKNPTACDVLNHPPSPSSDT